MTWIKYRRKRPRRLLAMKQPRDRKLVTCGDKGRSEQGNVLVVGQGEDYFEFPSHKGKTNYTNRRKMKYVEYATSRGHFYNPAHSFVSALTEKVQDAMDPAKQASKVKQWKDMTPEEQRAIKDKFSLDEKSDRLQLIKEIALRHQQK